MNTIKIFLLCALGLALTACDDYLDINVDPNQPETPGDLDLLLADMTATTAYNLVGGGNWTRYGAQWMQNIANNVAPPSNDTYRINTSDCNNEWALYSYAGVLINGKKMVKLGEELGQDHHVGVAKILMAHNYALLTDWWGEIPFSQALGREANGKPAYDEQPQVYDGIQRLLDEGIAALSESPAISLGGGDLLLDGDATAWIRFAYALKARYYLRLTAAPGVGWTDLKPQVVSILLDHFVSEAPLFAGGTAAGISVPPEDDLLVEEDPENADIVAQINELLETRVRPAVAGDGGDIAYRGFKDGVVYLTLQGACSGCPSSTATLKHGIEGLLKHYVPEVVEVRAA